MTLFWRTGMCPHHLRLQTRDQLLLQGSQTYYIPQHRLAVVQWLPFLCVSFRISFTSIAELPFSAAHCLQYSAHRVNLQAQLSWFETSHLEIDPDETAAVLNSVLWLKTMTKMELLYTFISISIFFSYLFKWIIRIEVAPKYVLHPRLHGTLGNWVPLRDVSN